MVGKTEYEGERTCRHCGKSMVLYRANQWYCTIKCRTDEFQQNYPPGYRRGSKRAVVCSIAKRSLKPQTEESCFVLRNVGGRLSIIKDQPRKKIKGFVLNVVKTLFRCKEQELGKGIVLSNAETGINTKTIGLSITNDLPIGVGGVSGKGIGGRLLSEIRLLARSVASNFGLRNGLIGEGLLFTT